MDELARFGRPMRMDLKSKKPILAPTGPKTCATWDAEAAMRMLMNNLHPQVALDWEQLVVYGGSGRAARNWQAYHDIIVSLKKLKADETLCVQSGKPVYVARTFEHAPRVVIANSNLVPKWATPENFSRLDMLGLTMYGQMTAGSWIYIGTQGILQGTYETLSACAKREFRTDSLKGKFLLSAGMGAMSGAQPLAASMCHAAALIVEARKERIGRKVKEGYCDRMTESLDEGLAWVLDAKQRKEGLSVGLVGNAAEVHQELVRRNIIPDVVTDQTSAHDLLSYVPEGDIPELDALRVQNPEAYRARSLASVRKHVAAMLAMQARGAVCSDYGNNLRQQAELAGLRVRDGRGTYLYDGFVPRYIRPLFCEGKGPFRWAALSGSVEDIRRMDERLLKLFPKDRALARWIRLASEKVPQLGLPSRICWLAYGDRATFGLAINDMVRSKELGAPVVIGRDHLDCGSVASPERETEGMADGSDAIADWHLLNFALNTAAGASWVSFHHGGGVGIGNSLHAGMVIVADGSAKRAERLERVLTVDPGIGVARHADAGYPEALRAARKGVRIPGKIS